MKKTERIPPRPFTVKMLRKVLERFQDDDPIMIPDEDEWGLLYSVRTESMYFQDESSVKGNHEKFVVCLDTKKT